MPLNPRQQRFVNEYLLDPNATQAAIKAGYRDYAGKYVMAEEEVKAAIAAGQARKLEGG